LKVFLFVLLSFYFVNVLGIETDLRVNLDKTEVKSGQAFTLELTVINPLDKTVQGGITVSFSSKVEVVENDKESHLYKIGSKVYCVGHIHCIEPTKEMMVENWYNDWRAGEEKTMNLTLKATETGTLKIYARAAFIENLKKKQVINIPLDVTDLQGYPAHVRYVSVKTPNSDKDKEPKISDAEIDDFIKKNKSVPDKTKIGKSFEFRAMTGMMSQKYADPFYKEFSDNIPFIGGGATVNLTNLPILGDISIDGYVQHSDKGTDGFFSNVPPIVESVNATFNRDDYAITVGHNIMPISHILQNLTNRNSILSFFWGYKWSETDVDAITIRLDAGELTRNEIHFQTQGPFAGLGYTQALDKKNQNKLGVYLAYGRLEGDYNFTAFVGDQSFPGINTVNPTTAWRYGLSFNGLVTRLDQGKLIYGISLDGYYYTMDLAESDFGGFLERSFVEEQVYSLNASLNWVFDF